MATKVREPVPEQEAPAKKKGKKKFLLLGLVLVLVAGGAGYVLLGGGQSASKAPKVLPTPVPYALPQFTTNLDDGHIVQAQVVLELSPGDTTAAVAKDLPRIENQEILTFGSMTYSELLPTSGRQEAATMLAAAINQVLASGAAPHDHVESILFESFIVQ